MQWKFLASRCDKRGEHRETLFHEDRGEFERREASSGQRWPWWSPAVAMRSKAIECFPNVHFAYCSCRQGNGSHAMCAYYVAPTYDNSQRPLYYAFTDRMHKENGIWHQITEYSLGVSTLKQAAEVAFLWYCFECGVELILDCEPGRLTWWQKRTLLMRLSKCGANAKTARFCYFDYCVMRPGRNYSYLFPRRDQMDAKSSACNSINLLIMEDLDAFH